MNRDEVQEQVSHWLRSQGKDPRCSGKCVCKLYRWSVRDGTVSCCSGHDKVSPSMWGAHVLDSHKPVIAHVAEVCFHLQQKLGEANAAAILSWLEQDWETLMAVAACVSKVAHHIQTQNK